MVPLGHWVQEMLLAEEKHIWKYQIWFGHNMLKNDTQQDKSYIAHLVVLSPVSYNYLELRFVQLITAVRTSRTIWTNT